jgi:hypothetical protein
VPESETFESNTALNAITHRSGGSADGAMAMHGILSRWLESLFYVGSCIATVWASAVLATDCAPIPDSRLDTQDRITNFQQL